MDFSITLLEWFRENGRDLPWRQTHDPYAIWLSEIILQQTQVKQGWEYWERFMRRWPTVEALAEATEDEVLREWQGLGYYSRARNLHFAAKQIVALGHFPNTLAEIKQLKGVGDYTAIVSSPVISASIPPSTLPKARNSSSHSLNPFCPRQNVLTNLLPPFSFLHPRNTIRPSWTSAPSSVHQFLRIVVYAP